jgi:aminoglycoside phosphotransferase family enzyme
VAIPDRLGQHRLWHKGDVLGIHFGGHITLADCIELRGLIEQLGREVGYTFLLVDMHESASIAPEARKYMARWNRESTEELLAGTAMYGISFAMRAIVTLTLNAIKFLGKKERTQTVFVKDEAEARRWIDAERARKFPGGFNVQR